MSRAMSRAGWQVVGGLAGIGAAHLTRKALNSAWRRSRHSDPPQNPVAPSTSWAEAITWAAATGVALGVARLVAQRGAAGVWRATTGALPPGLEDVDA